MIASRSLLKSSSLKYVRINAVWTVSRPIRNDIQSSENVTRGLKQRRYTAGDHVVDGWRVCQYRSNEPGSDQDSMEVEFVDVPHGIALEGVAIAILRLVHAAGRVLERHRLRKAHWLSNIDETVGAVTRIRVDVT